MKSAKAGMRMTSVLLDKRDPDGDPQWLVGGNQRVGGGLIQREASRLVLSASVEWQWSLVDYFECLDHDMAIHHFSLRLDLIKKLFGNATFESKPLVAVPEAVVVVAELMRSKSMLMRLPSLAPVDADIYGPNDLRKLLAAFNNLR